MTRAARTVLIIRYKRRRISDYPPSRLSALRSALISRTFARVVLRISKLSRVDNPWFCRPDPSLLPSTSNPRFDFGLTRRLFMGDPRRPSRVTNFCRTRSSFSGPESPSPLRPVIAYGDVIDYLAGTKTVRGVWKMFFSGQWDVFCPHLWTSN
jgi:hypothetical protein